MTKKAETAESTPVPPARKTIHDKIVEQAERIFSGKRLVMVMDDGTSWEGEFSGIMGYGTDIFFLSAKTATGVVHVSTGRIVRILEKELSDKSG